jgi:hypothetical protein
MAPLVPLFGRTFGRPDFTLNWLQRKYACEYAGIKGFTCVAFTEGQAASTFGMLPWPMRFGDHREIAAQVVDVATHDEHRRRGLFALLGEMALELCHSAGVSFAFGFNHREGHAHRGMIRRLGYAHIDDLVEYRLPVRTLWAERVALRAGPLYRLYERYVGQTLKTHLPADPVLENSLLSEELAASHRDQAFHSYKAPLGNRVLAVDGGRVWLKVRRGFHVGDVEAESEADMERTIQGLQHLAGRLGIHQIVFQSSKDTRFTRFFESRSPTLPCLTVIYKNLRSQMPPEKLRFTFGDQDNF